MTSFSQDGLWKFLQDIEVCEIYFHIILKIFFCD